MNAGMFTSNRQDWETPASIFDPLNQEFGFTMDVCATPENAKCERWYSADALNRPWLGICWCNPPYGKGIAKWVEKAFREGQAGATVVCLLPARTDTAWWHDYVLKADEVRFLRGRIVFVGAKHNAPFPSAIVIFRGKR